MDPDHLPEYVYLHKNHKYRVKLGFYAAPSNPKIFSKAIRDELHKLKFTYCSDLNGLVMGFGKISSNELIPADIRHCISVAVNVDVYIFKPPVGSVIEAIVNQTSDNHISCLVHNLFNVSIVRPEHQPYNDWAGSKIKKDDNINVRVLSFDLTKRLPHITGDIVNKIEVESVDLQDVLDNPSIKSLSSEESVSEKPYDHIKQIEKQDIVSSSSDSDSSSEMKSKTVSLKKRDVSNKTSSLIHTTLNNSKHINNPLGSSTPVSNTEHSVNHINLIRNKQQEQLNKHLAKNKIEKQKSLISYKSPDQTAKNNLFQSSNTCEDIKNDNSAINLSSISDNDNGNMNQQNSMQSDSGISDDELRSKQFLINKSIISTSKKSTKTTKNIKSPNKIVNAILNSLNTNKTDKTSNSSGVGSKTDHNENEDEKCAIYTQCKDDSIYLDSLDQVIPDNNKSQSKQIKKLSTLKLSTKRVDNSNTPPKKDVNDNKNQNEMKVVLNESNMKSSLISDSESNNSEDFKQFVKNIGIESKPNKQTEKRNTDQHNSTIGFTSTQYESSSEDEIYSKLRQNISRTNDKPKPLTEQIQKTSFLNEISSSDDESDSQSTLSNISTLNVFKFSTANIISKNNETNLSLNKKPLKTLSKTKQSNEKSTINQSSKNIDKNKLLPSIKSKKINKSEMIQQILKEDSISDDKVDRKSLKSIMTVDNKPVNTNISNQIPISTIDLKSNKNTKMVLNKDISNPDIKQSTEDLMSSSSDEDIANVIKSHKNKLLNMNKDISIPSSDEDIDNIIKSHKNKLLNTNKDISNSHINQSTENVTSSSSDKDIANMIKSNKNTKMVLNKDISNPDIKQSTEDLTSSSSDEDIANVIKSHKNKLLNMNKDISIPSSDEDIDNIIKSHKNKLANTNVSNQIPTSTIDLKSNKITKMVLNKDISNPDIKQSTGDLTSSSSDEDIANILKSHKNKLLNTNKDISNSHINQSTENVTSSSSDKDIANIIKSHKNTKMVLNKDISNPDIKQSTEDLTSSSSDEDIANILKSHKNKLLNTNKDISNSHINQSTENVTSSSSDKDIANIIKSHKNTKMVLNKDISNPDIKQSTEDLTSSSSDEDIANILKSHKNKLLNTNKDISNSHINQSTENVTSSSSDKDIANVIKSKKNSSLKDNMPLIKDEGHKNTVIDTILCSFKNKNKLPIEQISLNSSKSNKSIKTMELPKDESKVKIKNKNNVLEKLKTPVGDSKTNEATQNDKQLQFKGQVSSDDSTDDEIDFIRKMVEKRKLNLTNNTDLPESPNRSNKSTKLNKSVPASENLNKKSKSPKISKSLNKLTSDHLKTKKPRDTKDLILDGILNSLEDTSDTHRETKTKLKDHNLVIEPNNGSKERNSDKSLSKAKTTKKKSSKHIEYANVDNSICHDDKTQRKESFVALQEYCSLNPLEDSSSSNPPTKKKKKNHDLVIETNKGSEDKHSDDVLSKIKTKKKKNTKYDEYVDLILSAIKDNKKRCNNSSVLQQIRDLLNFLEVNSDSQPPTKKKKKDHNLIIETNNESKGNNSDEHLSEVKTKKKKKTKHDECVNINDSSVVQQNCSVLNLSENLPGSHLPTKKKKKERNLTIETNNESKGINFEEHLSEVKTKKKKKTKHDEFVNIDNSIIKDNKKQCNDFSVEQQYQNLLNSLEVHSDGQPPTKKKKKERNLTIETNNESKGINFEEHLSEVKTKKKKKTKHDEFVNIDNSIIKDNKKQCNDFSVEQQYQNLLNSLEVHSDGQPPTKKKKKDHNLIIETNNESKGNNSDEHLSEVKTKKKKKTKHDECVNINDSSVVQQNYSVLNLSENLSGSHLPTKKKKKERNPTIETNNESKSKSTDKSLSEVKTKKKKKLKT